MGYTTSRAIPFSVAEPKLDEVSWTYPKDYPQKALRPGRIGDLSSIDYDTYLEQHLENFETFLTIFCALSLHTEIL